MVVTAMKGLVLNVLSTSKKNFVISPASKRGGFTLIELMMSILLLGVLVSFAVPNMFRFYDKQSMIGQAKRFKTALEYARNEALSRIENVVVCSSTDGATCAGLNNWDQGWIIFVDRNSDNNTDFGSGQCLAAEDCMLKVDDPVPATWTLRGGSSLIGFTGTGDRSVGGGAIIFRLCGKDALPANDIDYSRTVTINAAGGSHMSVGAAACP